MSRLDFLTLICRYSYIWSLPSNFESKFPTFSKDIPLESHYFCTAARNFDIQMIPKDANKVDLYRSSKSKFSVTTALISFPKISSENFKHAKEKLLQNFLSSSLVESFVSVRKIPNVLTILNFLDFQTFFLDICRLDSIHEGL